MTYALVLGGGGITGIAWEIGLLKGLGDRGIDLTGADLIVGTSAGSVVGAQIATGVDLDQMYERQAAPVNLAVERAPDLGPLTEFFAARASGAEPQAMGRLTPDVLAWIGSQARAAATAMTEANRLEVIISRLPIREWPERRLIITAVDTEDGSFATWDRSSGVALPVAVASSCAVPWVYPPVTIDGHQYMDGGVRSTTNADVAAGHELIVMVAPMARHSAALDEEVADLRSTGSRVEVIAPDEAALEAIGPNPLDPARRPAAARAGLAQAVGAVDVLAAVWELQR